MSIAASLCCFWCVRSQGTGVRAILHTRNSGALTPPSAAETIADATFPIAYFIRSE